MAQLEHIEAIEKQLWSAADTLRSNSELASNEYFLPVMGLIFLRHAYSRYLKVKVEIEGNLPKRGGHTRPLKKEDFSQKSSIFLKDEAQFDYLVSLPDSVNRATAVIAAMDSIEKDYLNLKGVLPKIEYQALDNEVLGHLLRTLNPEELKKVSGDVFGRIYEYFLTQFADQKAHDGGEFFTPVSLVSLMANVIEPREGIVLDPACGSGGMFVQSAQFLERLHAETSHKLTFHGIEKNGTTIRLAKMNLAVHGLEGDIRQALTYYVEDTHGLIGKANYVMANPPFNVDEVDAEKVKNDPRLPFGLPGVNNQKKVSNGNYLWISYFYSYLSEKGKAAFVMSSQASSAGRDEAKVRAKLIETGDVDMMISIRSNFFYTRTVPCELWFLNRNKPKAHRNKVLMIDARNIYRKVTRKIYDFSPEQQQNLLAITWLYRGEQQRFSDLVVSYGDKSLNEALRCYERPVEASDSAENLTELFQTQVASLLELIAPFLKSLKKDQAQAEGLAEIDKAFTALIQDSKDFQASLKTQLKNWKKRASGFVQIKKVVLELSDFQKQAKSLASEVDHLVKLLSRLLETCEKECEAKDSDLWITKGVSKARKSLDESRRELVEQLKLVRYYWMQANWLVERFPEGVLCDVEGLVKLVDRKELEANDYSLTPGRYVGVAPEEVDESFDFEVALREIHVELEGLNDEAVELAAKIKANFEALGI